MAKAEIPREDSSTTEPEEIGLQSFLGCASLETGVILISWLGITIKFMLLVAFYWMLIFADPDQCFGYNFCIFLADLSFHQNRPLFGYMILISISIIVAVIYDGCMVEGVMKRESKYLKEGMECRAAELLVSLIFILLFASFSLTSWLFIIPCVTIQIYAILVIDSMRVILVKEENMNVTLQVV